MESLKSKGYSEPLKEYLKSGKPYMGICIGMQTLFEFSEESKGTQGLGIVPGTVTRFKEFDQDPKDSGKKVKKSIPQMGWNIARSVRKGSDSYGIKDMTLDSDSNQGEGKGERPDHFYFVHSYKAPFDSNLHQDWALSLTQYGKELFLSSIQKGNVFATQFHPEKSGRAGLELLKKWLELSPVESSSSSSTSKVSEKVIQSRLGIKEKDGLTKRVVACLDVRTNDDGDLVVTKGESYDVREKQDSSSTTTSNSQQKLVGGAVRNLGKPVDLALRYYLSGADEIVFLNITSFRSCPLKDQPMLQVVSNAASSIFVPLTIGGGIKDSIDPDGTKKSALEVATMYFRAGADKVSIGSEAVFAVEQLLENVSKRLKKEIFDPYQATEEDFTNQTGIETISKAYGNQAVVVSIDPRRVYLNDQTKEDEREKHEASIVEGEKGSEDEGKKWWYRCTVKGGREDRDLDVVQLARGVEKLGAGEVLVNSIDRDGSNKGFDRQLIDLIRRNVGIPVVASSGEY